MARLLEIVFFLEIVPFAASGVNSGSGSVAMSGPITMGVEEFMKNGINDHFVSADVGDIAQQKFTATVAATHCGPDPKCSSFAFEGSCTSTEGMFIISKKSSGFGIPMAPGERPQNNRCCNSTRG